MKEYKKPCCVNLDSERALAPLASLAALSVGEAALIGAAAGLALSKGGRDYKANHRGLPKCVKEI